MIRSTVAGVALCGVMLTAGGCLISKSHSTHESGAKVSGPTLAQVKPGETAEAWLLAAVGEPTSSRDVDEHTHLLRYEHTVTTTKGGSIFLLYSGGESEQRKTSAVFEITNGIVTRYWTES